MLELKTATPAAARRSGQRGLDVRLAVHEDFHNIVQLADSTRSPTAASIEDKLARHFAVPWQANHSPGYVLVAGQEIVGFLASLTHTRRVRGEEHTICNLGSWFVGAGYRRHSLTLVREALRRQDITYTAVSPIPRVAKIISRLGFVNFETSGRIIYPTINLPSRRSRAKITVGDVSSLLSPELLKIYQDHQELPCEHAVLEYDGRLCYLVLIRKTKRFFSSASIHYSSGPSLFAGCIDRVAGQLCRKLGVISLRIHERFLDDAKIRLSKRRQLEFPYMFRSNSLVAMDLDDLYTERLVMGF